MAFRAGRPGEDSFIYGEGVLNRFAKGVTELGGGIAKGFLEDPFVRKPIELLFGEDADDELIDRAAEVATNSTAGQVGEFIGTVGPMLAGGVGAFRGGASHHQRA